METAGEFIAKKKCQFSKELANALSFKHVTRKGKVHFVREAWEFMEQRNLPSKVFVFERLRIVGWDNLVTEMNGERKGECEYRIGYYIIGQIGTKKNKWTWGQYCPLIPVEDFTELIARAKGNGVILLSRQS